MEKKKIFISIPMTGKEDTVLTRLEMAHCYLHNSKAKSYEIVEPWGIRENFDDKGIKNKWYDQDDTAFFVSRNIELLLNCDAIYSCLGWENSKGCKVERYVAETYGLEMYEQ